MFFCSEITSPFHAGLQTNLHEIFRASPFEEKSVQIIVNKWEEETNNNYLTPTKIFNIYHHKKTEGLIRFINLTLRLHQIQILTNKK